MSDRPVDSDAEVPDWVRELGITDRLTGQERARASWNALIAAGRRVLGTGMDYSVEHLVFSGFLARAQGLHEGGVAAIRADNPYAAFTLLRAYAENAAAILYVKDHPVQLDRFWRHTHDPGVPIGKITNHAVRRFDGFKGICTVRASTTGPHLQGGLSASDRESKTIPRSLTEVAWLR